MLPCCNTAIDLHDSYSPRLTLPQLVTEASNISPSGGGSVPEFEPPLYEAQRKIYPQAVQGTFRRIKWIVLAVTLGVYYLLPFIRWDRGPNLPHQAVLLDLAHERFYFFFIEIWPQEVYYITGLLVLAAMTLFLMNAVAGRVWCGYLCPQTVWTDLFYAIERRIEGDRREHMQHDAAPWSIDKVARKALKHFLWLMVAWWTGGAWVLYFADAPTLVKDLATFEAPFIAYVFIGILTLTTYVFAGHMREQVCLYMCPWPRIQAALTDEHAFNVAYLHDRGEPRGSVKKNAVLRQQSLRAGDCIDCLQCVAVCPTGVDIRQGASLGCIQCGLCIDACDAVMAKIDRPTRLIAYETDDNIKRRKAGQLAVARILRARTIMYVAIIAVVGSVMIYGLATRANLGVNIIHDRNPIFVRLADGDIRNGYTVRILNKLAVTRHFTFTVEGLSGASIDVAGMPLPPDGDRAIEVRPDQTRELRILITDHAHRAGTTTDIAIVITDRATGETARASDHFRGP
jgi:cytochrome c oxidase accessory protein FixG